jgi:hypothetical protein
MDGTPGVENDHANGRDPAMSDDTGKKSGDVGKGMVGKVGHADKQSHLVSASQPPRPEALPQAPAIPEAHFTIETSTDFASAAAMAHDILSADSPENEHAADGHATESSVAHDMDLGSSTVTSSALSSDQSLSADFFTASRPKRRFWRNQ